MAAPSPRPLCALVGHYLMTICRGRAPYPRRIGPRPPHRHVDSALPSSVMPSPSHHPPLAAATVLPLLLPALCHDRIAPAADRSTTTCRDPSAVSGRQWWCRCRKAERCCPFRRPAIFGRRTIPHRTLPSHSPLSNKVPRCARASSDGLNAGTVRSLALLCPGHCLRAPRRTWGLCARRRPHTPKLVLGCLPVLCGCCNRTVARLQPCPWALAPPRGTCSIAHHRHQSRCTAIGMLPCPARPSPPRPCPMSMTSLPPSRIWRVGPCSSSAAAHPHLPPPVLFPSAVPVSSPSRTSTRVLGSDTACRYFSLPPQTAPRRSTRSASIIGIPIWNGRDPHSGLTATRFASALVHSSSLFLRFVLRVRPSLHVHSAAPVQDMNLSP